MTKLKDLDMNELKNIIRKTMVDELVERTRKDDKGRLLIRDKDGLESLQILPNTDLAKAINERLTIKEASRMSLQKKEKRMVINLPEWMKDELLKRAKSTDKSMNEIIRTAIADYLSKEKA
jgi:hypothetical protein